MFSSFGDKIIMPEFLSQNKENLPVQNNTWYIILRVYKYCCRHKIQDIRYKAPGICKIPDTGYKIPGAIYKIQCTI